MWTETLLDSDAAFRLCVSETFTLLRNKQICVKLQTQITLISDLNDQSLIVLYLVTDGKMSHS